jgi:hypothetical protein
MPEGKGARDELHHAIRRRAHLEGNHDRRLLFDAAKVAFGQFLPIRIADAIASMDMFVVPTISFRLLYGLLILRHSRRELLWLGVLRIRTPNGLPGS